MFPVFMAKTTGFLFIVGGITALLGAFAQVNPIWQFGPYDAARISYAVQPDWYMGFLDGALRIWPLWTFHGWGHTIPFEVLIPAVVLPGLIFNFVFVWPMIERKFTKDHEIHHLLDRPSNVPARTAVGVTMLSFLGMLFIASSTDVLAKFFNVSLNTVLVAMRYLTVIVPILAFPITYRICHEIQTLHGGGRRKTPNVVARSAEGEYTATPSPRYVDDVPSHLEATPVPDYIHEANEETGDSGVRVVDR
jgi:ubiquinol-cytochrome c reductase cytochrome b subunit